jgi:hypothetical protein
VAAVIVVVLVISLGGVSLPRNPCAMLSSSTVASYAPGATCQQEAVSQTRTTRIARWDSTPGSGRFSQASIDVSVELFPSPTAARREYTFFHQALLTPEGWTVKDHRDVTGTDDRAFITYDLDDGLANSATSWAVVLTGKAVIHLDCGATVRGDDGEESALSQKQTENGLLAITNDILAQLS